MNDAAANITPDLETGIGAWTDDEFDTAVRKGIGRRGGRLYPAMPTLYFKQGEYVFDPQKPREWNRGAYLVDGPTHCGACHTPKSILGGDRMAEYLQGSYLQGWSAPDITNDASRGLGNWTIDDIAAYLRTGHNRTTAATGPMAEAVELSFSKLTDDDARAIATYLKSLPGRRDTPAPLAKDAPATVAGNAIYRDQCASCHGLDGKGIAQLFPSIAVSSMVRSDDPPPRSGSCCAAHAASQPTPSRLRLACRPTEGN